MKKTRQAPSRRAIAVACAAALGVFAASAHADDGMIPGGQETLKLNLGGIITQNNSNFRLDGNGGRGTDIDLESITGLKSGQSSYLASGMWRFASNHRIGVSAFQIDRDHSAAIDRTITIGDNVIPINTNLSTEARTQFFIVNYAYSFVKNPDMELAATIGLYGANFKYKFSAVQPLVDVDKSTNAPLPVIGLRGDFYINPSWTVSAFGEGLKLKVGDVDGSMYHVGVTTDYMVTRNFGVGIGYQVADLKVDVTKSDFNGHLGWRMDGYFGYAQMKF